jgi:hypothetical protein
MNTKHLSESVFLEALLSAKTLTEAQSLLEDFVDGASNVGWHPIGDRRNNSGTIQAAGDPARAVLERVTNAIDAVLEREARRRQNRPQCATPRLAAQSWLNVPRDGLFKLDEGAARALAQETAWLSVEPGEGPSKRTVEVADFGCGLSAVQMPSTILSLNADNKMDKFYLVGAFGQGGSATFASAQLTLVASHPFEDPSGVSFTLVKYEPPRGLKLGSYLYLTQDGRVLEAKPIPRIFGKFSTRVRHFGYDLDNYTGSLGPNSIYGRAQTILFDPVLPFWLADTTHPTAIRRTIKGVRTALHTAAKKDAEKRKTEPEGEEQEAKLSYLSPMFYPDLNEHGRIGIEYWVLEATGKQAPNRAFVNSTRPIVLTVNGQTHAEWSASLLRKGAGLLHLASRMVVHLDCNDLVDDAKRVLFVSNREESRAGVVHNVIANELISALKADERLLQLNEEARLSGMKERDAKDEKEIRQEVAKLLRVLGFSVAEEVGTRAGRKGQESGGPSGGKGRPSRPRPQQPGIPVSEPPTFIHIRAEEDKELSLFPGQRRYIRIHTDAGSQYYDPDPKTSRIACMTTGSGIRIRGTTPLREGHMRAVLSVDPGTAVGTKGTMRVELRPHNAPTLADERAVVVVNPPPVETSKSSLKLPKIDIRSVDSQGDEWANLGWSDNVNEVAGDYYLGEGDELVIRYSSLFPDYRQVLDRYEARRDKGQAESLRKRFELWLTASVIVHWQDESADPTSIAQELTDDEKITDFRRDEIRRLAKLSLLFAQREFETMKEALKSDNADD